MYRLLIAIALIATVSRAQLPTGTVTRAATEAFVTNRVAIGVAQAIAKAGTNTQAALSSKVSLTDATYTATVARAASALQSQTQQLYVATAGLSSMTGTTTEWITMSNGTATLFRVYNSGLILQGFGSPDYMGLGPSAPPDTYIFQSPSRIEDGGITEIYDIPMASGYIHPFSLAVVNAGIYSEIDIGSPQLSPSLWRTFETNYPVTITPFPDEPGVQGYWVLSKITDAAPITNSYPLAMVSDIPAPVPQTNQLYVSVAGTVAGPQSNLLNSALQPYSEDYDVAYSIYADSAWSLYDSMGDNRYDTWAMLLEYGVPKVYSYSTREISGHLSTITNLDSVVATRDWVSSYVATNVSSGPGVPSIWTNQTWGASGTNATYQMSWDASNGTFRVVEILP